MARERFLSGVLMLQQADGQVIELASEYDIKLHFLLTGGERRSEILTKPSIECYESSDGCTESVHGFAGTKRQLR